MLKQMGCWPRNGIKRYENVVSEICPECNARIKVVQYAMQCKQEQSAGDDGVGVRSKQSRLESRQSGEERVE